MCLLMIALVALGQGEASHPLVVVREAKLVAPDGDAEEQDDHFGHAVSNSGDTALIGAPDSDDNGFDSGSAYVFVRHGKKWLSSILSG